MEVAMSKGYSSVLLIPCCGRKKKKSFTTGEIQCPQSRDSNQSKKVKRRFRERIENILYFASD